MSDEGFTDTDQTKLDNAGNQNPTVNIHRSVVWEVLDNLSLRSWNRPVEELRADYNWFDAVTNKNDIVGAPRNSIIIKLIGGGAGRTSKDLSVCYPFFSSHISLPLKVGEQVWIIYATTATGATPYWMSRVTGKLWSEDPNYTHGDRDKDNQAFLMNEIRLDGDYKPLTTLPTFHNGEPTAINVDRADELTLANPSSYDLIFTGSAEVNSFAIEPVPRFTKRPGDLVLQGSHNTTIVLGTDRGYTAKDTLKKPEERKKSNAGKESPLEVGSGTIDLVAGRGRIHVDAKNLNGTEKRTKNPVRCEPRVINNSHEPLALNTVKHGGTSEDPLTGNIDKKNLRPESYETDKNLNVVEGGKLDNNQTDGCEGDPDFVNDASRVYISMKTNPDDNFSLTYPQVPKPGDAENKPKNVGTPLNQAAIVAKSDHIRIIARQTGLSNQKDAEMSGDNADNITTQGSINIVKEGIPDDEEGKGRAVIMLNSDGVIMIDGPKIVLGSGIEKANGKGTQVCIGVGAKEPVVLGDILKTKLEAYMDAVSAAFQYASTHVHPTGTGPSGPPTGEQWSAKKSDIDTTKGELSEILSKLAKTL